MPVTLFPLQWCPSTRASTILFFPLRTCSCLADASIRLRRHDWWLSAPHPGFIASAGRPLYTSIRAPRPGFVANAGWPCGPAPPPGASSWNRRIRQPFRRHP
ncbi:hypothetical protein SETIT_4G122800v2 [Setaria italica]|uniref:Uncharacterized protein n=1 Tax=Setaria italica TaxID=4555 RepID=A0A368QTE7_SETIT|nr:hypothetical protein SETIT_4G122800v2 [Setaria italica]